MSLVQIDWHPNASSLRKFGLTMAVGFGLLGALFRLQGHPDLACGLWIFGGLAGAAGLSGTRVALPVYWAWMSIALVMGNIMSRIILTLFYFLLVTPCAVWMRLIGRDRLKLKRKPAQTYWTSLPERDGDFERQF